MAGDTEPSGTLERWEARLKAGNPIMEFVIDEPFWAGVSPEGGVAIKFVSGPFGDFETAAMALAILTPAAARRLKAMMIAAENIPDTPLSAIEPRSRN